MKHAFSFAGFTMKEGRLIFGNLNTPNNNSALQNAPANGPVQNQAPGAAPIQANRQRVQQAVPVVKSFNDRNITSIKQQFEFMKKSGKSAADAQNELNIRYPNHTLVLQPGDQLEVTINASAPAPVATKESDLMQTLSDPQKRIVEQALNELGRFIPEARQHIVDFISADPAKRDERIAALSSMQQFINGTKPKESDRFASYMASISDGNFASIDAGVQANDPVAVALKGFLDEATQREMITFSATIFKDIATSGPSKRTKDPNKLGGAPGTAQDELDAIMNDPNMPSATREQQIGMIMFNHGVEVREENGKLVAKEADPNQRFGDLINRFSGFIRFVTALVGSLKSSVDEVKNSIAGKAGLNNVQTGPQNKVEVKTGTEDDPVDPDLREELQTKKFDELKTDLNTGRGATAFDNAKNERDTALTQRDTAKTIAENARTAITTAERAYNEDTSDPKDPTKKAALETARGALPAKELALKHAEELLKSKEDEFQKVLDKQKKLTDSKKEFDKMDTDTKKDIKKADDIVKEPILADVKEAEDLKGLIAMLGIQKNEDNLTIKAASVIPLDEPADPTKPTIKSMLEENGMDVSVCDHDGETVKKPRALAKAIQDLAEKIKVDNASPGALKKRYSAEGLEKALAPKTEAEAAGKMNDPTPILKYSVDNGWEIFNLGEVPEEELAKRVADAFIKNKDMAKGLVRDKVLEKVEEYLNDLKTKEGRVVMRSLLSAENAPASVEGNVVEFFDKAHVTVILPSVEPGKITSVSALGVEQAVIGGKMNAADVDQWIVDRADVWSLNELKDRKSK